MICKKCGIDKDETCFHSSGGNGWCKACRKLSNTYYSDRRKERKANGLPTAERSTLVVRNILAQNGIPSCFGSAVDAPWIDLMAWACVPVEAKIGAERVSSGGSSQFVWRFTDEERSRCRQGFCVFVGKFNNGIDKVYVVPSNIPWMYEGDLIKQHVTVSFGPPHFNSKNEVVLRNYENRFDLITSAIQEYAPKIIG